MQIRNYYATSKIGFGGMGVVYRAVRLENERPVGQEVALKVLPERTKLTAEARLRFEREVQSLRRVNHPGVARVVDFDTAGDPPFIATEFIEGPSLEHHVSRYGALNLERLAVLARDLGESLAAVHKAGMVHRDVKPSNLLLRDGRPVLIDFGIARMGHDSRLTSTGLVMGTPGYLSPEIIDGEEVTVATDWWGWAATLVYAATGKPPFGEGNMGEILGRVARGSVQVRGIDPVLAETFRAALVPNKRERLGPAAVLARLEDHARGQRVAPLPLGSEGPGSARPAASAAAMGGGSDPARGTARLRGRSSGEQVGGSSQGAAAAVSSAPATARLQAPVPPPAVSDRARMQSSVPSPAAGVGVAPPVVVAAPAPFVPPGQQPSGGVFHAHTPWVLFALAAAWVAFTAYAPFMGLILLWLWSAGVRSLVINRSLLDSRRARYGRRPSDTPVAAVLAPVTVLRGLWRASWALIFPVIVGFIVGVPWGGLVSWVFGMVPRFWAVSTLLVVAIVVISTVWIGPISSGFQWGSRYVVNAATPNVGVARIVAIGLLLLAVAVLWAAFAGGGDILWSPFRSTYFPDPVLQIFPQSGGLL